MIALVIRSRVLFSSSVSASRFRVLSSFFGFGFGFRCYVSVPFALLNSVSVDVFRLGFRPVSLIVLSLLFFALFQYCIITAIVLPFRFYFV